MQTTELRHTTPTKFWEDHYASPTAFGRIYGDYTRLRQKNADGQITGAERTQLRIVKSMIDGQSIQ